MLFTSQVIASASGSAGGLTASRNRFGMYFRARTLPVNPQTTFQQNVRANLAFLAGAWAELTSAQRDGWNTYGDNVTVQNKLGQPVNLTGFLMYVRSNTPRLQAGIGVIDDAPSSFVLPSFTPVTLDGTVNAGTTLISVNFNSDDPWDDLPEGGLTVALSRPVSPTINYFKGPFRFNSLIEGDATTPPTNPSVAVSPFTCVAGQRVYAQVRLTDDVGGLSSPQIASCVLQAA